MSIDDDIRAALDGFAQRAPHPERVRSALAARIRRHRQRRMLLTVGTVAAGAAAVGVPAFILLRPTNNPPPPGNLPTPLPDPSPGGSNLYAPMILRPTWLPEGLTELYREGRTGELYQLRTWASKAYVEAALAGDMEGMGKALSVSLRVTHPVEPTNPPTGTPESPAPTGPFLPLGLEPNTTVGPHPAYLGGVFEGEVEAAGVELSWVLEDGRVAEINLSKMPDAVNVTRRIAASVVPDTTAGVEIGFSFGWLPAPVVATPARLQSYRIGGLWVQSVEVNAVEYGPSVRANLRNEPELGSRGTDGRDVTVRGRPGKVVGGEVVVELDNGVWLGVTARDEASAIRVADEIVIGPPAYQGWIGTR